MHCGAAGARRARRQAVAGAPRAAATRTCTEALEAAGAGTRHLPCLFPTRKVFDVWFSAEIYTEKI